MREQAVALHWAQADRIVDRLFLVTPTPQPRTRTADRLIGFALLVTAARCVLRYVVLPFGLPLLGLAPGVAVGVTIVCDVLAVAIAVTSVRRLWAARHPTRWRYLALVCLVLLVVVTLRVSDATTALAASAAAAL